MTSPSHEWQPGDPLYVHPDLREFPDSPYGSPPSLEEYTQFVRPIFQLINDVPDDLQYKFISPHQVRFCRVCEVLWVNDPHCFSCDAYVRPNTRSPLAWMLFVAKVYNPDPS